MSELKELINLYKIAAKGLLEKNEPGVDKALLELENQMLDGAGLSEGDHKEALANMDECRKQLLDEHAAGGTKS